LSTLALEGSSPPRAGGRAPATLRYADLGLLAIALPVFLVADLPMLGYVATTAAWIAQWVAFGVLQRRAADALRRGDRRTAVGSIAIGTLGRVWLVTAAILLVGLLADREDGLAAAVLAAVLVTVHLGSVALERLLWPDGNRS
jgi:hypothetical protein